MAGSFQAAEQMWGSLSSLAALCFLSSLQGSAAEEPLLQHLDHRSWHRAGCILPPSSGQAPSVSVGEGGVSLLPDTCGLQGKPSSFWQAGSVGGCSGSVGDAGGVWKKQFWQVWCWVPVWTGAVLGEVTGELNLSSSCLRFGGKHGGFRSWVSSQ